MTAQIIDGKQIATDLRAETKQEVDKFIAQYEKKPTLAVVLVGEDPASQVYVKTKTKMECCKRHCDSSSRRNSNH